MLFLSFSATASIVYHAVFCLSRTFLNFFLIFFRNPWVSFRSLSRSLGTGIRIPDVLPNVNIFFHFFCVFHVSFFCSFYIYKIRRHILCRTQDMPPVLFTGAAVLYSSVFRYTICPSTIVITGRMVRISSGLHVKMSVSSTAISARYPGFNRPLKSSANSL